MTGGLTCPTCGRKRSRDGAGNNAGNNGSEAFGDRDEPSTGDEQSTSDAEFAAAGGDPELHERMEAARSRSTEGRAAVARLRDRTAAARRQTTDERDRAADLRDRGAAGRDRLAELHDSESDLQLSKDALLLRAQRDRARAAADRAKAADDRRRAAADRENAANERYETALQLERAATDQLTGAWTRQAGLPQVAREIERAHRTGAAVALAFVDVDGLKEVNGARGHTAGDALLRLVGQTLRSTTRAYDIVVRYGGDEFVCAMPNVPRAGATERLERARAAVAAASDGRAFSFGVASIERADELLDLLRRADAELSRARQSRTTARD